MSTTQPRLAQELVEYNNHLDHCLRCTLGMSLTTWKTIKATTQLIGVLGVLWLVILPGELNPQLAALLITIILGGAEAIEIIIQNTQTEDQPTMTTDQNQTLDDLPSPDYDGTLHPEQLEIDGDNPNEMSDDAFGLLCERMQSNGWLGGPIITNSQGLIADGEHRWRAAQEIDLTEVPVKQYDITEATRRLWRQELNKIHGEHDTKRDALEYDYLLENRAYDGPRWDRFFPMLLPHTQLNQDKELFVFAIAESIDFREALWEGRSEYELYSFPYGEFCQFTQKRQLIEAREEARAGISFGIEYDTPSYFEAHLPRLELIGEWDGEVKRETVTLEKNATIGPVGPFSALNSVRMPHDDYRNNFSGNIHVSIAANGLDTPVRNTARRNLNVLPRNREDVDGDRPMTIQKTDFINLRLPDDYTVHVLGWITKPRFLRRCREYRSWIWPDDSTDRMQNQPWSQLTEKDESMLTRIELDDVIQDGDHRIGAGFRKGIPFGGSAATYVFLNQHGGA